MVNHILTIPIMVYVMFSIPTLPHRQARALGFMETYMVCEAENGQWGHVHFTGPEGYEARSQTPWVEAGYPLVNKQKASEHGHL